MNKIEIIEKIQKYLEGQKVKRAALIGSFVNDELQEYNDIDIILEMNKGQSLIDLSGIKLDLEELLDKKIDVLTYNSLRPLLKNEILQNAKLIYEQR